VYYYNFREIYRRRYLNKKCFWYFEKEAILIHSLNMREKAVLKHTERKRKQNKIKTNTHVDL